MDRGIEGERYIKIGGCGGDRLDRSVWTDKSG